jgi:hypothetical protein
MLARSAAPLLQAVPLGMLRVAQAERPEPLPGEPRVDLIEVAAHE